MSNQQGYQISLVCRYTRLMYASRFASVANGWKKWIGEKSGLERTNAVGKKLELEQEFSDRVNGNSEWKDQYGHILPEFDSVYNANAPYTKARIYYDETFARGIQLFRVVSILDRAANVFSNNGKDEYANLAERYKSYFEGFYGGLDMDVDQEICAALLTHFAVNLENKYVPESLQRENMFMRGQDYAGLAESMYTPELSTYEGVSDLLSLDGEAFVTALTAQPAYQLYQEVRAKTDSDIATEFNTNSERIQDLQRQYMTALMEVFPEKTFWPDANSTLRVTYGYVEGYEPRDAVKYEHVSFLAGVIEKYIPEDYEFDVHPKLLELYESKDYGQYADKASGQMPVCFLGSNHTSGGNSGSPAIDAHGNLIGLNFDRVWEGTMSDISYDRSICRNIMVDIRYVLFVVDKFAGAGHLIDEMEIVHPKS